jgi:hypothetical protein
MANFRDLTIKPGKLREASGFKSFAMKLWLPGAWEAGTLTAELQASEE